jgi:tetratricopeptide (TPR) repeat protein
MGYLAGPRAEFEDAITKPLERAVELDPAFAAAWAALGHAHLQLHNRFDYRPERMAQAREAIERAQRLDPKLAEVHVALAYYFGQGLGEWPRAVEQLAHALAIAPGYTDAISYLATAQFRLGRWTDGMANLERTRELDPAISDRPSHAFHNTLGLVALRFYGKAAELAATRSERRSGRISGNGILMRASLQYLRDRNRAGYFAAIARAELTDDDDRKNAAYRLAMHRGDFASAAALYARTDENAPGAYDAFHALNFCQAAWLAGERAAAKARALGFLALPDSRTLHRRPILRAKLLAYAGDDAGGRELAAQTVAAMPLSQDAIEGPILLMEAAEVHLVLGEGNAAIALLERALSVPSAVLYSYGHPDLKPLWASVWEDVRYKAALEKMKSLD